MLRGLYAIIDVQFLQDRGVGVREFAEALRAAGVGIVQLRDKLGSAREVLRSAAVLCEVFAGSGCSLVMNDRVDLAVIAGFDGVHVGQGDLAVEDARVVLADTNARALREEGAKDAAMFVGVSTHAEEQVRAAAAASGADYVAVGPVFSTGTKADAAPVVGIAGVRRARALTTKPLVAIGGITRANAREVVEAGADCVAVISGLLVEGEPVEKVARDFLAVFR